MLDKRAVQILFQFPDPIIVLKSNYQVEYTNAAFEKMFSISLETICEERIHDVGSKVGKGWSNLIINLEKFSNNEIGELRIEDSNNLTNHNQTNDPLVPKRKIGQDQNVQKIFLDEKVYFYEFFNVFDVKTMNLTTVIRFREITEEIKITDQMIQAEKMSGLGTLAAGLAHEFNNPLYSIIGLSEMIISKNEKGEIDSIAKRIIDNSRKMVSVVENLATYSHSSIVKDREAVNLNERLDAALELALLAECSKTVTINKNFCSMAFLRAKPEEVEQIFFNILSNSIQAMRSEGDLNISSYRVDDERITVKIQDTGEGVPIEFIEKVFDPFFTTKEQGQGTGLGLTVAYQLLKKYDGTIKFDSVQGEGTTVEIHWPVNKEAGL
jgi:two-component system NtrC family sensor kinase